MSPDGRYGLTLIAFVGGVFSPYYAAARRRGPADPLDHCALNVCLYLPGAKRWTLTERGREAVARTRDTLRIGPSALKWDGARLTITIDEATPLRGLPVRGEIVVTPGPLQTESFVLDSAGRHLWRPFSVAAQVEAKLSAPALDWSGEGYLDHNIGQAPLERDFRHWTWRRTTADAEGRARVFYDVRERSGARRELSLRLGGGAAERCTDAGRPREAAPTAYGLRRRLCAAARRFKVVRAFEDSPFYARSSLSLDLEGTRRLMMHEALALDRFKSPLMQWALPYRIPHADRRCRRVRWAQSLISLTTWP